MQNIISKKQKQMIEAQKKMNYLKSRDDFILTFIIYKINALHLDLNEIQAKKIYLLSLEFEKYRFQYKNLIIFWNKNYGHNVYPQFLNIFLFKMLLNLIILSQNNIRKFLFLIWYISYLNLKDRKFALHFLSFISCKTN